MKKLIPALLLALTALVSCAPEPNYPDIPSIKYVGMINRPMGFADSTTVTVYFEDGDGDLGLGPADTLAPYGEYKTELVNGNPVKTRNRYYHNFFIDVLKKVNGTFRPIKLPDTSFTFSGRYPVLNPLRNKTALSGNLSYSLYLLYFADLRPGDIIKFKIQIADRALRESNSVESPEMVVGK